MKPIPAPPPQPQPRYATISSPKHADSGMLQEVDERVYDLPQVPHVPTGVVPAAGSRRQRGSEKPKTLPKPKVGGRQTGVYMSLNPASIQQDKQYMQIGEAARKGVLPEPQYMNYHNALRPTNRKS